MHDKAVNGLEEQLNVRTPACHGKALSWILNNAKLG